MMTTTASHEAECQHTLSRETLRIRKACLRLRQAGGSTELHIAQVVEVALVKMVRQEMGAGAAHTLYCNACSDLEAEERIKKAGQKR